MSLIQGNVKQHIDGSMQKDTAVFSSITEIGRPCIKPPISVIWMNDIMTLMQCPLLVRDVNLACHREVHFASVFVDMYAWSIYYYEPEVRNTRRLPGMGVTNQICSVSLSSHCQNPVYLLNITLIFHRCQRSSVTETPIQYECDLNILVSRLQSCS